MPGRTFTREDRLQGILLEARRVQSAGARLVALVKLLLEDEDAHAEADDSSEK